MENIQITKDCVQLINNIGSTTYQNICNGTSSVVSWGSGDWVLALFFGLFSGGMIFAFIKIVHSLCKDNY